MWEILPDPTYVANPVSGSGHNRGGAVDVSLVTLETGVELPMPTTFDFFGPEAGHDFMTLPADVLANRAFLKDMMERVGGLTSYIAEWWHYSYQPGGSYPLLDFQMK
jgi:D-alanyl-D-alanine dipeptidase